MEPKPGLPLPAIIFLKLILTVSNAYYAKILPLYRGLPEHRHLRPGKIKNTKGLRVKIYPSLRTAATNASPLVLPPPKFPVSQPNVNPRKRRASPVSCIPIAPAAEPPSKKIRALTDATAISIHTLSMVPLLTRLQDSLSLPSLIVLRRDRWLIIRQRDPVSLDEPPNIPEDLVTVKVPPKLKVDRTSR